jgi:hypothetical protein
MLAVDLMHEFELGVWKTIYAHLIRLLYAVTPGGRMVTEFDRRYVSSLIYVTLLMVLHQVPAGPNIWPWYNPTFFHKRIRDEKNGGQEL